jgi:hypothetical protein
VLASVLATVIWDIISRRLPVLSKIESTSINGFWVARFPYAFRPGWDAFNVFRISIKGNRVKLYIEHYNNNVSSVHKVIGIGIYDAPFLSAVYKFRPSFVNQSGTLTLRLKQKGEGTTVLTGICSQIVEIEKEKTNELIPISEDYTLHRISIPLRMQIRMIFGKSFYRNYTEVLEKHGEICN